MGDFNINLMNYEADNPTSHVLDNICLNSFFSYINIPTHHTSQSKTLIDNILYNGINGNTISGNITTNISDHLAQFLITSYQTHSETNPKKIQGPLNSLPKIISNMTCKVLTGNTPQTFTFKVQITHLSKYMSRKQQKTLAKLGLQKVYSDEISQTSKQSLT